MRPANLGAKRQFFLEQFALGFDAALSAMPSMDWAALLKRPSKSAGGRGTSALFGLAGGALPLGPWPSARTPPVWLAKPLPPAMRAAASEVTRCPSMAANCAPSKPRRAIALVDAAHARGFTDASLAGLSRHQHAGVFRLAAGPGRHASVR
jgi:hypothetical protein